MGTSVSEHALTEAIVSSWVGWFALVCIGPQEVIIPIGSGDKDIQDLLASTLPPLPTVPTIPPDLPTVPVMPNVFLLAICGRNELFLISKYRAAKCSKRFLSILLQENTWSVEKRIERVFIYSMSTTTETFGQCSRSVFADWITANLVFLPLESNSLVGFSPLSLAKCWSGRYHDLIYFSSTLDFSPKSCSRSIQESISMYKKGAMHKGNTLHQFHGQSHSSTHGYLLFTRPSAVLH